MIYQESTRIDYSPFNRHSNWSLWNLAGRLFIEIKLSIHLNNKGWDNKNDSNGYYLYKTFQIGLISLSLVLL